MPVCAPMQARLLHASTSLLALRPLLLPEAIITNRHVPRGGDPGADARLAHAPLTAAVRSRASLTAANVICPCGAVRRAGSTCHCSSFIME
jgi:hypothetical protein